MCLPLSAENISYISLHKIHIRPLRGGRPRTDVRVASRNIRAGAEKGGRWIVIRVDAKRDFLLREGGFSVMRERIFCFSD